MSNNMLRRQQILAVISMYFGYAMFMVLRMIPGVAGAAMQKDPSLGIDLEVFGKILSLGTCGAIHGKFIGGYAADRFGGRITFAIGLGVLLGIRRTVCRIQLGHHVSDDVLSGIDVEVARLALNDQADRELVSTRRVWSCLGDYLDQFSRRNFDRHIWLRSITGDTSPLERNVVPLLCGVGILAAITFLFLDEEKPAEDLFDQKTDTAPADDIIHHPLNGTSIWQALCYFSQSIQFWLITGSLMGLTILWTFC